METAEKLRLKIEQQRKICYKCNPNIYRGSTVFNFHSHLFVFESQKKYDSFFYKEKRMTFSPDMGRKYFAIIIIVLFANGVSIRYISDK